VQIDAADASTPPPAAAAHGGARFVVLGLSILLFVVSALGVDLAARRRNVDLVAPGEELGHLAEVVVLIARDADSE